MYKNEDFDGFSTVTLTITIARDGGSEREVVTDMVKALIMYLNFLPRTEMPDYVKEISLV